MSAPATSEDEQELREDKTLNLSEEQIKKRKKRRRVAQELLETEEAYVKNLEILKSSFYDPLNENSKGSDPVITPDDVRTIFGSLNIILPVNKLLLAELQKRLEVPETEFLLIGEAFETLAYCLKSYTAFCNDFDNARHILTRLKKNSDFSTFYNKISSNTSLGGKTLFDLMILPVQRIPRYRMLLQELFKNTWETHPDYPALTDACYNINKTAQSVEDSQENHANVNKIASLQQDLKVPRKMEKDLGSLLQADRKFVIEDALPCSEGDSQETTSRKLILFNDMLLVTKVSLEKSKDDKKKTRETMRLKKIIYLNQVSNIVKTSSVSTQPSLSISIGSTSQFHLHITNQKQRDTWYSHLADGRAYALQKKEMNDRSTNTSSSPRHDSRTKRLTLRRKKTNIQSATLPSKETVFDNPLFGVNKHHLSRKTSAALLDEDHVKKSPSMNAMTDPKKRKFQLTQTTESESGDQVRAAAPKRSMFSRSTSVDCINKITPNKKKKGDTSQLE